MKKITYILAFLLTGILSAQTIVINGETYNYGLNPLNYLGLKNIDISLTTPSAVDDDFAGSSLDAKWTVVQGQVGTVQLLDTVFTGDYAKYDMSSRKNGILVQCRAENGFQISQDYTLSNGESIILKASYGMNVSSNPEQLLWGGLSLSDDTPRGGNYNTLFFESNEDGWRFVQQRTGGVQVGAWEDIGREPALITTDAYFRISKIDGDYYCFYSLDGLTWAISSGGFTPASDFTKIFVYAGSWATKEAEPLPVIYFQYIRLGSNNYDPWTTY